MSASIPIKVMVLFPIKAIINGEINAPTPNPKCNACIQAFTSSLKITTIDTWDNTSKKLQVNPIKNHSMMLDNTLVSDVFRKHRIAQKIEVMLII